MDRNEAEELLNSGPESVSEWNARVLSGEAIPDLAGLKLPPPNLPGIDLHGCNLSHCEIFNGDLTGANLRDAVLTGAVIIETNLIDANLRGAKLDGGAHLDEINLDYADMRKADLTGARSWNPVLEGADLSDAILTGVQFRSCIFSGANLSRCSFADANLSTDDAAPYSNFSGAILVDTDFRRADLTQVIFGGTTIACELGRALNLETVEHYGPSAVYLSPSLARLPKEFLRGCGLADWEIESVRLNDETLPDEEIAEIQNRVFQLRCSQPLQLTPLFLSYSHKDSSFVDSLQKRLAKVGVRFWRDIHDAPAGPLDSIVEKAMRAHPVVLLVLSEHSVESDWVEAEATLARELEKENERHVLCPVALDDNWKKCNWSRPLRTQIQKYNVLDFSNWRDGDSMTRMFERLEQGLGVFYSSPAE